MVVHSSNDEYQLWWVEFRKENGSWGWGAPERVRDITASRGAGLTPFTRQNLMYCVYPTGSDAVPYNTRYSGTEWLEPRTLAPGRRALTFAVAEFNHGTASDPDWRLHCIHGDNRTDTSADWMYSTDGSNWSDDKPLYPANDWDPALATSQQFLYCVHGGAPNDNSLYWTRYDGKIWSPTPSEQIAGTDAYSSPALAVYQGEPYCLYKYNSTEAPAINWTAFRGGSWSTPQSLPDTGFAPDHPAVAVTPNNELLLCVYRGQTDELWWATYDGNTWTNSSDVGVSTEQSLALARFRDRIYLVYAI